MESLDLIDVIVYIFLAASVLTMIAFGLAGWINRNEANEREDDEEQREFLREWNSRRDRGMSGLERRMATPRGE